MPKSFENMSELFSYAESQKDAVTLEGMIKQANTEDRILYSSLGCDEWISIPRDAISSAE